MLTDMRLVGVFEIDALDKAKWKKQITRQTQLTWKKKTLNGERRRLSLEDLSVHIRYLLQNKKIQPIFNFQIKLCMSLAILHTHFRYKFYENK